MTLEVHHHAQADGEVEVVQGDAGLEMLLKPSATYSTAASSENETEYEDESRMAMESTSVDGQENSPALPEQQALTDDSCSFDPIALQAEGQEAQWIEDEVSTVASAAIPFARLNWKSRFSTRKSQPKKKKIVKSVVLLQEEEEERDDPTIGESEIEEQAAANMVKARECLNEALTRTDSTIQETEQMAKDAFALAAAARLIMSQPEDQDELEEELTVLAEEGEQAALQHQKFISSRSTKKVRSSEAQDQPRMDGMLQQASSYAQKAVEYLESIMPSNVEEKKQDTEAQAILQADSISTLGFKSDSFEYQMKPVPAETTTSFMNMELMSISSLNEILDGPEDGDKKEESHSPRQDLPEIDLPNNDIHFEEEIVPEEGIEVEAEFVQANEYVDVESEIKSNPKSKKGKKKNWGFFGKMRRGANANKVAKDKEAKLKEEEETYENKAEMTEATNSPEQAEKEEETNLPEDQPASQENLATIPESATEEENEGSHVGEIPTLTSSFESEIDEESKQSRYLIEEKKSEETSESDHSAPLNKMDSDWDEKFDWQKSKSLKRGATSSKSKQTDDWDENLNPTEVSKNIKEPVIDEASEEIEEQDNATHADTKENIDAGDGSVHTNNNKTVTSTQVDTGIGAGADTNVQQPEDISSEDVASTAESKQDSRSASDASEVCKENSQLPTPNNNDASAEDKPSEEDDEEHSNSLSSSRDPDGEHQDANAEDLEKAVRKGDTNGVDSNLNAENTPGKIHSFSDASADKKKSTNQEKNEAVSIKENSIDNITVGTDLRLALTKAVKKAEEANMEAEKAPSRKNRRRRTGDRKKGNRGSSLKTYDLVDTLRIQAGLEINSKRSSRRETSGDAPSGLSLQIDCKDDSSKRDPPKADGAGFRMMAPTPRKKALAEDDGHVEESADLPETLGGENASDTEQHRVTESHDVSNCADDDADDNLSKYDQHRITERLYGGNSSIEEQSAQENTSKPEPLSGGNGSHTGDKYDRLETDLLSMGQEEMTVDPDGKSTDDSVLYDDEDSIDQRKVTELLYGETKCSKKSSYIGDLIVKPDESPVPERVETEESEEIENANETVDINEEVKQKQDLPRKEKVTNSTKKASMVMAGLRKRFLKSSS